MQRLCYLIIALLAYPIWALASTDPASAPVEMSASTSSKQDEVVEHRSALEQRVLAKWDALIRKDFAAAYAFTSPGYRSLFSLDAFKRGFSIGKVAWQRVEVTGVDFKGDNAATVGIKIYFVYHQTQAENLNAVEMTTHTKESWVHVDGQWWYLVDAK